MEGGAPVRATLRCGGRLRRHRFWLAAGQDVELRPVTNQADSWPVSAPCSRFGSPSGPGFLFSPSVCLRHRQCLVLEVLVTVQIGADIKKPLSCIYLAIKAPVIGGTRRSIDRSGKKSRSSCALAQTN